jgi:uncharacterized membrane protein YsdA (DUF1294 family)
MAQKSVQPQTHYRSAQATFGWAAVIAVIGLGLLLYWWLGWNFYWTWAIVVNVVTFFFFRYDKGRAATEGATRVPEVVLLALVLCGGVLGGLGGMLMRPHHKTHKSKFWIVLAVSAALHLYILFAWVLN